MDPKNTEAMVELLKKELGPLAEALGQGAGKTFEIFVKQAWVYAIQNLLWIPVGIVIFIVGIILFRTGNKPNKYDGTDWGGGEWVVLICSIIIMLVTILLPITGFIQVKMNPEYAALQLMVNTFKNSN
jgi:uncharacterized membrane protein